MVPPVAISKIRIKFRPPSVLCLGVFYLFNHIIYSVRLPPAFSSPDKELQKCQFLLYIVTIL